MPPLPAELDVDVDVDVVVVVAMPPMPPVEVVAGVSMGAVSSSPHAAHTATIAPAHTTAYPIRMGPRLSPQQHLGQSTDAVVFFFTQK